MAVDLPLPCRASLSVSVPPRRDSPPSNPCSCCAARMRFGRWNGTTKVKSTQCWAGRKNEYPVTVRPGSFRLGRHGLLLWLETAAAASRCSSMPGSRSPGFPGPVPAAEPAAPEVAPGRVHTAKLIPSGPRFEVHHVPLKIIRLDPLREETFGGVQGLFSQSVAGELR